MTTTSSVGLFEHALDQALGKPSGCEILILDDDGTFGTIDGIEE